MTPMKLMHAFGRRIGCSVLCIASRKSVSTSRNIEYFRVQHRALPFSQVAETIGAKAKLSAASRQPLATMSYQTAAGDQQLNIQHDDDEQEFCIRLGQDKAVLEYTCGDDGSVDLWHTEVPPSFRGKGVAKLLAQAALDHFAGKSISMRLSCTYLQKYAKDFPQPDHQKFIISD